MATLQKVALVTGAGTGIGKAVALALMQEGYAAVFAGRRKDKLEEAASEAKSTGAKSLVVPTDVSDTSLDQGAVRRDQGDVRPPRPPVQQCRHRRAGGAARGPSLRDLEEGRRYQPHRHVPVHAGSDQDHEGAGPARRPHHQQRFDLRARAAPALGRLYRDQARGHRADQVDRARLPRLRHHLRTDRHRQRRHPDDRAHGARPRRHAGRRPHGGRAAHERRRCRPRRGLHGQACRSTPTYCS